MIICRTILSGTKLDARCAPAGCAPEMARIKGAKSAKISGFIFLGFSFRPSRLCGEQHYML